MSEQPPEVPIVLEELDFRRMLAREVQRATRYPDFLSLCLVRLNPPSRSDAAINVGSARMQRALQEFALAASSGGRSGPISVEFALAAFPGDATTVEALLDRAQARLSKLS